MTKVVSELYDALRAAGVSDDRAKAAAHVSLYGQPPGFIAPLYDALRSVGVSQALARAAATADYRAASGARLDAVGTTGGKATTETR